MISIIVPIYNAESFLQKCVNSILSQTNKDWELILVDDGSLDKSSILCDEFARKDSRIRVIHKSNGGVSSARNIGIDVARGDWIAFIDADDYVSNNYFEAILDKESDIVLVESCVVNWNGKIQKAINGISANIYKRRNYENIVKDFLLDYRSRVPWAKFIKRKVIGNTRFELGQKIGEDTVFMYDVLSKAKSIDIAIGQYYYWVQGIEGDMLKYRISVEDAIRFAKRTFKGYESISVKSIDLEKMLLLYYFNLIDKRYPLKVKKWFENSTISSYDALLDNKRLLPSSYRMWKKNVIIPYLLSMSRYLIANILYKYHTIQYKLFYKNS